MTRDRLFNRWLPLAFPFGGALYVVLWCIAETGRGRGLPQLMPPPDWAVFAGFGTAIGLAGRFPRSASIVALATLAATTFVPGLRLFGPEWAAFLALPIVGAAVASAPRRRGWSAAYTVVAIVLLDCWIVLADSPRFVVLGDDAWLSLLYTMANPFAIAAALVMAAAWAGGCAVGMVRSRYAERLAAARQAGELRAAELELAASLEHERIAREIHDVVAHSLAAMVAQADGARFAGGDDAEAREAFAAIADNGRGALVEVRGLLDSLAGDTGETSVPGVDGLAGLVARTAASGLDVVLTEHGTRRPLAPAGERALYRIVQEGLTNALRHGGRDGATSITLEWRGPGVGFEIVSPRRSIADRAGRVAPSGRGLVGMRERARLAEGWLGIEPDDPRGFVIAGFLPAPMPVAPEAPDAAESAEGPQVDPPSAHTPEAGE